MNFSEITDDLWIGTPPGKGDYELLRQQGVKLIINMRFGHKSLTDHGKPPLNNLWLRTFDSPIIPIPVRSLKRGVQAALDVISSGGKVRIKVTQPSERWRMANSCS